MTNKPEPDKQIARPLKQSEKNYFVYDGYGAIEFFATEQEAQGEAETYLERLADDAADMGWMEEGNMAEVCWGSVRENLHLKNKRTRPPEEEIDDDSDFAFNDFAWIGSYEFEPTNSESELRERVKDLIREVNSGEWCGNREAEHLQGRCSCIELEQKLFEVLGSPDKEASDE